MGTFDEVGHLVERQVDPDGDLGVGDVGAATLDPLQVVGDVPLGEQDGQVTALVQCALHELDAVVRQLRQLLQRLLLLVQRLLLRVTHLVQPVHQLFTAHVYRVRQSVSTCFNTL